MPGTRKKTEPTEYQKQLRAYHQASERHVLVTEASLSEDVKRRIFADADRLRQCGNKLTGIMKRRLEQLTRTKRYRNLQTLYGKTANEISRLEKLEQRSDIKEQHLKDAKKKQKVYADGMLSMQAAYGVTWDACRNEMIKLKDSYGIPSIFALSRAEDIWQAVEKLLYSDGQKLHFKKRGDLPEIRAKQAGRGIIIKVCHDKASGLDVLVFSYNKQLMTCICKEKDRWLRDEMDAVIAYLKEPDICDAYAVSSFTKDGQTVDTYRPCYASIVCKIIRGRLRVFIHLTVEGRPLPKFKNGRPRHVYGRGVVGIDIGTQSIAYTSDTEVGLENLAERGESIRHSERLERRLLRAIDRSRRSTNPDNYNEDGTIRKGRKTWTYSKRYLKLKKRFSELCRINAVNRKLACREAAHHLRTLGDVIVTEPKNAKKLQKRAKPEVPLNKNGQHKRRKRFGRSIKNRCPGYFQACLEQIFTSTGGKYKEVPNDYRASQYDHTADDYIKKKLSQRMYRLSDGTLVQRDWYSSFLLYCINDDDSGIDRMKCNKLFKDLYKKEQAMIAAIACSGKKIMNSGIRACHAAL